MHSIRSNFPFSAVSLCGGIVGILLVSYVGLIAVVMSYATLTIEFSQSVKNDEAAVATLEGKYLATVMRTTATDYVTEGYILPIAKIFVPAKSSTALR